MLYWYLCFRYTGRELAAADPYLASSIGPVAGYGVSIFNR